MPKAPEIINIDEDEDESMESMEEDNEDMESEEELEDATGEELEDEDMDEEMDDVNGDAPDTGSAFPVLDPGFKPVMSLTSKPQGMLGDPS